MRPFETSPQARAGTTPPVHTVSLEVPLIELAGDSTVGSEHARDHGFVTGSLRRTLVLGPSTLALDEGTPWFGGTQGTFLAVAAGGRDGASAQAATSTALRVLAGHATAVMPWLVDADGGEVDDLDDVMAHALDQCRDVVLLELERCGIPGPASLSASLAYLVWPNLFCASIGEAAVQLIRGGRLRGLAGTRDRRGTAVFRAALRRGDDVVLSTRPLSGRIVDAASSAGDVIGTARRLADAARSSGEPMCFAMARVGERADS